MANEAEKEKISLEQEIIKILARRAGLVEGEVRLQRSYSNVLQDQVKHLTQSANERRKILSLSKKLVDLSEKVFTFDTKGLGTTTKSEKIHKQLLKVKQAVNTLEIQKNKIESATAALQEKNLKNLSSEEKKRLEDSIKLNSEINRNINSQIALTSRVVQQLEKQKEAAAAIEDNTIADSFVNLGNILGKIPFFEQLMPGFKEAGEAAKEIKNEAILMGSGFADASEYSIKNLAKFGEGARVEFTHTQSSVDELQAKAAKAQEQLDAGAKDPKGKLASAVKKGDTTKVGSSFYDEEGD